jgi:uncharacterized protein YhfF
MSNQHGSPAQPTGEVAFAFGDSPAMADELLALVIAGEKTATCAPLREFGPGKAAMPQAGRRDIVLDGRGRRRAVIETLKVEVLPFEEVPLEYAIHAGEGMATVEDWRQGYRRYIDRHGGFETGIEMVCERFRLIEVLDADEQDDEK